MTQDLENLQPVPTPEAALVDKLGRRTVALVIVSTLAVIELLIIVQLAMRAH